MRLSTEQSGWVRRALRQVRRRIGWGYSRGRWNNEQVLVVQTTQVDWSYFDDSAGTPQSDAVEITEVFTLSDDQQRLDYRMIVTDPELFTEPATVIETYWVALGEALVQPPNCAN